MTDEAQREHKIGRVRALRGDSSLPVPWVSAVRRGYRRRIRMRVDDTGRPRFFNNSKIADCLVLTPELRVAVERVRALRLHAAYVEVRAPDLDGRPGLFVAGRPPDPGEVDDFVTGDAWQRFAVTANVFSYVPLDAFLQVNEATNRALVQAMAAGARQRGCRTFFDAYAGAGNHALALASSHMSGIATDRHARAMTALDAAARAQGLSIDTRAGDARDIASTVGAVDLLICNPPRAGLRDAALRLAGMGAKHVLLVTCTPEAFARDAAAFEEAGYMLDDVTAFDMFPHTEHLELMAWLSRRASRRSA